MIVIGLTGGIGMGKSTVALQMQRFGAKICSADAIVHALLAQDKSAIAEIARAFPGALVSDIIHRPTLGKLVFSDAAKRRQLEAILHPRVVAAENHFLATQRQHGVAICVLDIPLLFETGAEARCDLTVLATAPFFIQRARILKRAHMTREKFAAIVAAQMPETEKKQRADILIQTGLGLAYSFRQVALLMKDLHAA